MKQNKSNLILKKIAQISLFVFAFVAASFFVFSSTIAVANDGEGDGHSDRGGHESITICHATHSASNPYVEITVDINGLNGHGDHEMDIIPAPAEGCPNGDNEPENTPPAITLLGDNPLQLFVGDIFTDPGATATDTEDGDLTGAIIVSGIVDTSIAGTSTLTYSVTDTGGLSASTDRSVIVSATSTPPNDDDNGDSGSPTAGSIRICKMIADNSGVVATTSIGLPESVFVARIATSTNYASTTVRTVSFDTNVFVPNTNIIATSTYDAACETFYDLPFGNYRYDEERLVSGTTTPWSTPLYNDQYSISVNDLEDFFAFDPETNVNADGWIIIGASRPARTLVILNTFSSAHRPPTTTPQAQCSDGLDNDQDGKIDANDPGCHADNDPSNSDSYDPERDSEIDVASACLANVRPQGNDSFLTFGKSFDDELSSLSNVLLAYGYSISTSSDQEPYSTWTVDSGSVTFEVTLLASHAANKIVFGYYSAGDADSFVPLFRTGDNINTPTSSPIFLPNQSTTTTVIGPAEIAFAIQVYRATSTAPISYSFFSEKTLNPDNQTDHTVVFNVPDGYVLGFEDLSASANTDNDFNDLIVRIRPVSCFSTPNTNTPPAITLLGDNPLRLFVGDVFTDPGATATDTEDGDLTSLIVATGTVNSSVIGTSTIFYTVTDSGGLATSTTRFVEVWATTTDNDGNEEDDGGGDDGFSGSRRRSESSGGSQQVAVGSCSFLNDYLRVDLLNDPAEVTKLQTFLRVYEGESNLQVTGVFDQATFDAVSRFQNKYFDDILAPWGHNAPTGYVYILTRNKINEIFCNTAIALTSGQQSEIDSFRAFLESLRQAGGTTGAPAGTGDGEEIDFGTQVGEATPRENEGLLAAAVTSLPELATSTATSTTIGGNLRNLAAAVLAFPQGFGGIVNCILQLVLALALVYILVSVIVGEPRNGKTLEEVRQRKLAASVIGLIATVLVGIFFQIYCIVVPILVIIIIVSTLLLWRVNKA